MMKPGHVSPLYRDQEPSEVAGRIRELARATDQSHVLPNADSGRRPLTRRIDAFIGWIRRRLPFLHRAGAAIFALLLFIYCRIVGLTARLRTVGERAWPDLPAPSVLALWHGAAPSFLCAVARRRPRVPLAIMVSHDARGDSLALLCRMMGLRVVRGDSTHRGWEALAGMGAEVERGCCAILTPDGGGPARSAKPGAVVLAAATGAPLLALGADCAPALSEPNKWDSPRNPLPFSRVAIAISSPVLVPAGPDAAAIDSFCLNLQHSLDRLTAVASQSLNGP